MKLFDAHCHLKPSEVLARAAADGVTGMAVCGTSSKDWNEIFQCSAFAEASADKPQEYPQIFPNLGIHPWLVSKHWKEDFQTLEKRVRSFPMIGKNQQAPTQLVGIGETGLDFREQFTNRAEQEASFVAHLDLARELNRPVTVHCIQAWGRLIEILREHPAPRVLLHAFGGAPELIPELKELNCWFSFCGSVTNPQAKRVRASAAAVPSDRLLIETDSAGEPEKLILVARAVAEIRKMPVEDLAALTFENAERFFYA
jgi:TatD DNase family protein